nr:helix-turn-helix transcriptional regulator [Streptomyces caeruleatus]
MADIRRKSMGSGALCLNASGFRDERPIRFAILSQLTHTPGIPEDLQSALLRLIDEGEHPGLLPRLMREIVSEMAACAARKPLLLLIDDAHQMDTASQSCLLHITRRIEPHAITVALVFPRTSDGGALCPLEFVGLGARLIETPVLGEAEVDRLLRERTDVATARRLTSRVHAISGGNPALVTALLRDLGQVGPAHCGDAVPVGDGFRTAYLGLLVRHPHLARCVEGLAVLGENATPPRVARLLEQCPVVTGSHLEELEAAGLLADNGFRHPAVPGFVLGVMDGDRLRNLHRRAAELLFADGAPTTVVARHLVITGGVPDVSQVSVLLHASHQLLLDGQVEECVACLRLADRADLDDQSRDEVTTALIDTLWCTSPAAAEPEVRRLLAAARERQVCCASLRLSVTWLLWFGKIDLARETLAEVVELCGPGHDPSEELVRDYRTLLGYLRPGLLEELTQYRASSGSRSGKHRTPPRGFPAAGAARWAQPHEGGPDPDGAPGCEGINGPRRFWTADLVSVLRLVWEGDLGLADRSCAELLGRPPRGLPARQAFLAGVHAHIRWTLGDVGTAAAQAASALQLLPDHNWGITIGLPLSTLINTHTVLGDLDRAADYLERPVPPNMQGSFFGALYAMARGRWLLAAGQADAALDAFLSCAPACEPSHARGIDLLGWRASAAEAYLALGAPEEARRMTEAELATLCPRPSDDRGRAVTVLADAPEQRRAHLEEAEQALRLTGSRLPLAAVLTQLSRLALADGNTSEARARQNEALDLVPWCGVSQQVLLPPPFPSMARTDPAVVPQTVQATSRLSEAEWRVASLAAEGKSNRQIAKRLFITVSTVEQHLTRVYRKLRIRRRSALSGILRQSLMLTVPTPGDGPEGP